MRILRGAYLKFILAGFKNLMSYFSNKVNLVKTIKSSPLDISRHWTWFKLNYSIKQHSVRMTKVDNMNYRKYLHHK